MTRDDGPPFEIAVYRSAQRLCVCNQSRFKSVGQTTRAPKQRLSLTRCCYDIFRERLVTETLACFSPDLK